MKRFHKMVFLVVVSCCVNAQAVVMHQGVEQIKNGKADSSELKGATVTMDENGNSTVNVGKGNKVANESGTVDGKKVTPTKKIASPKGDADEAFWGKGGFWGERGNAP